MVGFRACLCSATQESPNALVGYCAVIGLLGDLRRNAPDLLVRFLDSRQRIRFIFEPVVISKSRLLEIHFHSNYAIE